MIMRRRRELRDAPKEKPVYYNARIPPEIDARVKAGIKSYVFRNYTDAVVKGLNAVAPPLAAPS